jgi:hypothetical protein
MCFGLITIIRERIFCALLQLQLLKYSVKIYRRGWLGVVAAYAYVATTPMYFN